MTVRSDPLIIHVWRDRALLEVGSVQVRLTDAERNLLDNSRYRKALLLASMVEKTVRFCRLSEKTSIPEGDYFFVVPPYMHPRDIRACLANSTLPKDTLVFNAKDKDKGLDKVISTLTWMLGKEMMEGDDNAGTD